MELNRNQKLHFWSRVNIDRHDVDKCWEWKGTVNSKGYGSVGINGKVYSTHRIAWMLANGREPLPGMFILHSCDNRRCNNPNHLREGTHQENTDDMHRRGRANMTGLKNVGKLLTTGLQGSTL